MQTSTSGAKQRRTQNQKDKNDYQWYKDQADQLDQYSFNQNSFMSFQGISEYKRKKVNYDLFNNIIDRRDFEYVCQPYGAETGDLPANFTNRDIVSGKIKVLLGMEMKMPFSWRVIAVNQDATTRREQQEFGMVRDYVTNEIMRPIKMEIQSQTLQQTKGRKLTPEEEEGLQKQIAQQTQARTPDEVRKYMTREHQDPAEVLSTQILNYLIQKEKINDKFNKGWKHNLLSGTEVYEVGILNGEPYVDVVNSLFFDYDMSPDLDCISDGEWGVHELRMTPSEVVSKFGSQLTEEQIDQIYEARNNPGAVSDADFSFDPNRFDEPYTVRILHTAWKSLRKIGFLLYLDSKEQEQLKIVDENYKLNKQQGDVSIDWEWIPEAHECWKIMSDIYVYMRPVPGQYKDLDNLWHCKLPFFGSTCDNLNSPTTAAMDRMKGYQYLYDIIVYRIELLMASDKGKILAANINAVPKSAGIDVAKFQYFMEANKIAWFNPQEEGNRGTGDITNMVKEIDMSLVSDIAKYQGLAEYIERKCGSAIGVTPQMEAQIASGDAVGNTRQNLIQSSHIIQPYFELHNTIKGNVLSGLIEAAKVAYSVGKPKVLSYVLDDMSYQMLQIDQSLLDDSTYGLFVANSAKADEAKQAVINLAQAAMQNQQADLVDIMKVIRADSVTEAEELLEVSQEKKSEQQQSMEQAKLDAQEKAEQRADSLRRDEMTHEKEMVVLKEEERRETELQKQAMLSTGFDINKDEDNDGEPDVLEIYKMGTDVDIKIRKQNLEEERFRHEQEVDKEKLSNERKKISNQGKTKPK